MDLISRHPAISIVVLGAEGGVDAGWGFLLVGVDFSQGGFSPVLVQFGSVVHLHVCLPVLFFSCLVDDSEGVGWLVAWLLLVVSAFSIEAAPSPLLPILDGSSF